MDDYKCRVEINSSSDKVFDSISKRLTYWWGEQDRAIKGYGDVFKVSWGIPWYQFKVKSYKEGREMTWECIDSNQVIEGLDGVAKEWVGSTIHWKLIPVDKKFTVLDFTHEGLTDQLLCFHFCSSTWTKFLNQSLKGYVEEQV